jgi:hypothetical protein
MKSWKQTNKLFFEKYVNKVSLKTPLSGYFRGKKIAVTRDQCLLISDQIDKSGINQVQIGNTWNKKFIRYEDVSVAVQICNILSNLEEFKLRVEGQTLGIYFNDPNTVQSITNIKNIKLHEVSVPAGDEVRDFLLSKPKLIIRKEYTHKYKVTISGLWDGADNFKTWAEKLPKIKTTSNRYMYGGHFYVADDKTLSLCRIFLADKIRKVEEIVTANEI